MKRILIADDNPDVREVVTAALTSNYEVCSVTNGEEAIEALSQENFDALILDVEMPQTDGWETLRIIRDGENGFPETKVIMLTCLSGPDDFLKSAVIGADYFLGKPFDIDQLLSTVDLAVG